MTSRPTLQLFPPPQRMPPRQISPNRSPNRKLRVKPPSPEPAAQRMDSAKSAKTPVDFHELVIQVNSVPVSPSVAMPQKAHIPNPQITRTPPQESNATFDPPSRQRTPSPAYNRRGSPSDYPQEKAANPPELSIQTSQHGRSASPNLSPHPNRPASGFSENRTVQSGSPTLVRPNSAATNRSPISPSSPVPMRSMFPVYNPTVPLARQEYRPTDTSPTHAPNLKISRSPYSPDYYIPHANVANTNGGSSTIPKPYFTPSNLLDNLWVSCNGQEDPVVQIYTLRMHRATAIHREVTFGTTPSLPFYSLTQANLSGDSSVESIMHELLIQRHHPSQPRALPVAHLDLIAPPSTFEPTPFDHSQQQGATLLTQIYPKLAALAALDAAANSPAASHIAFNDPSATSPAAQRLAQDVLLGAAQRESCALAWTRDATTQPTNPWAHAMPSEGSYQLHHPMLGVFPIQLEGDCSGINRASTRPQTAVYGHHMQTPPPFIPRQAPASITLLNPFILSPSSPRAFNPPPMPPRIDTLMGEARPDSLAPSELDITQLATTTDAAPDDAMLAKLDFVNDALILNVGALARFGNPFLVDVAASTLLAVAVAESVRRKGQAVEDDASFEPPPPSFLLSGQKPKSSAASFKESFVEGWEAWGGRKKAGTIRKWSLRSSKSETSFDKDIELGEWYGQMPKSKKEKKKGGKTAKEEEGLPFVTRTIIGILSFAFKAIVWILTIGIKVIAGVVVMISRNISKL